MLTEGVLKGYQGLALPIHGMLRLVAVRLGPSRRAISGGDNLSLTSGFSLGDSEKVASQAAYLRAAESPRFALRTHPAHFVRSSVLGLLAREKRRKDGADDRATIHAPPGLAAAHHVPGHFDDGDEAPRIWREIPPELSQIPCAFRCSDDRSTRSPGCCIRTTRRHSRASGSVRSFPSVGKRADAWKSLRQASRSRDSRDGQCR